MNLSEYADAEEAWTTSVSAWMIEHPEVAAQVLEARKGPRVVPYPDIADWLKLEYGVDVHRRTILDWVASQ